MELVFHRPMILYKINIISIIIVMFILKGKGELLIMVEHIKLVNCCNGNAVVE